MKKDLFLSLKRRKDFKEAVWMHIYHQQIKGEKIDLEYCPICQTPATITMEIKNEKS